MAGCGDPESEARKDVAESSGNVGSSHESAGHSEHAKDGDAHESLDSRDQQASPDDIGNSDQVHSNQDVNQDQPGSMESGSREASQENNIADSLLDSETDANANNDPNNDAGNKADRGVESKDRKPPIDSGDVRDEATKAVPREAAATNLLPAFPGDHAVVGLGKGNLIPEIVGKDLEGTEFRLSDYQGKVIMLDLWGDW